MQRCFCGRGQAFIDILEFILIVPCGPCRQVVISVLAYTIPASGRCATCSGAWSVRECRVMNRELLRSSRRHHLVGEIELRDAAAITRDRQTRDNEVVLRE